MATAATFEVIERTDRFKSDYKSLPPDLQAQVKKKLRALASHPLPGNLRFHRINAGIDPKIFSIDVTSNKSHKISLHIENGVCYLRRVDTHKEIDRNA